MFHAGQILDLDDNGLVNQAGVLDGTKIDFEDREKQLRNRVLRDCWSSGWIVQGR